MEDTTAVKFEINIAAERMLSQILIRNERFENELKTGIEKAIESFDFEKVIISQVQEQLRRTIQDSASWGKLRELAHKRADEVVQNYIDKEILNFEKDLNEAKIFTNNNK